LYNAGMFFATTPEPPYWAVIFTSIRTANDATGYQQTAEQMEDLAKHQPGYLGIEHAGSDQGSITVSYWRSLEDIAAWRRHADHLAAQRAGRERWYRNYTLRVAKVERASAFP
jgi:heme-degrading monooxygenase HmoA